ncbi:HD domain-containing protein [Vagococcus xieshaowenii]|uniref:HD domain-containing protein n=1 Tax=Vagococcus xieshaowenii TaxID=2562451 RepID=A0A4Z0D7X5_9ENTE|nr:HD domain-containing protein [Vagococcus xieshaowenii]QCA29085.1 HD domain-containing protein [Vagococcus xieshaowenii]TFZ40939.1 HD domain-containing protein [Vagococcus xieshaowenii]
MEISYKHQLLPIEKVFKDPVHNDIQVQHQVILDLINAKEFQRLRRIKQLGTASFTFHGGEHSRFSHSLGVYEITRQICDIFERNFSIEKDPIDGWNDEERLVALCAALLHDVGHGPYSHTFEAIFSTNHEQFTVDIITSPFTEIYQILNKVEDGFPQKVASVITKQYPNQQVVQMISSQIDADRMDYLLRDAYFTGTQYGTFDLTRILRVIRPYNKGICFTTNGMHAVEDYIVSRYQMYMQVYFHPVSRGMEVILDHLLKYAEQLFKESPDFFERTSPLLVPFLEKSETLSDYLKLDDHVLNSYFMMWCDHPDETLSDLSKRFLNRKPLKSVKFVTGKDEPLIEDMKQLIEKIGYDTAIYTAINTSFDLPYDFYRPNAVSSRTQIELMEYDGTLIELSKQSSLVRALAGEIHGDERFYFPKEMLTQSDNLFNDIYRMFQCYIHNGKITKPN